jgi:hypothetical protein
MKDRVSNKLLDSIGGYKGLEEKLRTDPEVTISLFRQEFQAPHRTRIIVSNSSEKTTP